MADPAATPPLFRQRNFVSLWTGQLVSILGDRFTYLALIALLAEHTHQFKDARSPWLLSLLANVMLFPTLLFAPFTGAWVDRWNLKRVLVISDLLRSLIVLLIPISYAFSAHTVPVFALVFLAFAANVFFLPAKSAITPEIVPPHQLLAANALLSGAGIAATAVGAIAGGWIVDHWGWARAMQINAGTYLFSVFTLACIRYRAAGHHATLPEMTMRSYVHEVLEGWRVVRTNSMVGLALTALAAVWIGGGFLHVAGNPHIQQSASIPGMQRLGVLLAVLGVGAGLGTWWMNRYGRAIPHPLLLGIGFLIASVGLVAFAVSTRFAVFAASGFLVGISIAPAFVLTETLLQRGTSLHQRGRIFSTRDFLMRLAFLFSVTLAAPLTRMVGTQVTLIVAAALVALAGGLSIAWGRHDPALMRSGGPEPAPAEPPA
jgi:MFS family permease